MLQGSPSSGIDEDAGGVELAKILNKRKKATKMFIPVRYEKGKTWKAVLTSDLRQDFLERDKIQLYKIT